MATADGLGLYLSALDGGRLRDGVDARIVCEHHEDWAVIRGDDAELVSANHRDPLQMMDTAAAAYVALTIEGTDTLLIAADHSLRRELLRRIRDDLIRPCPRDAPFQAPRHAEGAAGNKTARGGATRRPASRVTPRLIRRSGVGRLATRTRR